MLIINYLYFIRIIIVLFVIRQKVIIILLGLLNLEVFIDVIFLIFGELSKVFLGNIL